MAKVTNGPIGLWLGEQLDWRWRNESKKRQRAVKVLFLRVLLQDLKSPQFKAELNRLYRKHPERGKKLGELRSTWATSEFSNRYKLALLRFRKNMFVFKSYGFEPIQTLRELIELKAAAPELRTAIRSAKKQVVQPLSLRHQEAMILQVTDDLRPRLYTFTRKRQSFIVTSHNSSHDDMVGDLLCRVIENARWYYPFRSYQHMINSCYQAAYHHGINRIKWFNAGKRRRLMNDGSTGFYNREVAEEAEYVAGINQVSEDESQSRIYNDIFYTQLLEGFAPGKDRDTLLLLLGVESDPLVERFFDWSAKELGQSVDSVDQLIEQEVHDTYIQKFLGVDSFQVNAVRDLLYRKVSDIVPAKALSGR